MAEGDPRGVVVDAAALVDLLAGTELSSAVRQRLTGEALHAPAIIDAECLSALGRLHRAGSLDAAAVETTLADLTAAPITRHPLPDLLAGAWSCRGQLRLTDALYVELAARLGSTLVTRRCGPARGRTPTTSCRRTAHRGGTSRPTRPGA
ncbi:type II toxin-antitoxin system VapC family toxin [Nocardioides ferulae]|uniref:type II toxin-antitoxin system VapC family toxin n=1 Tax=Nocardioides ferulae TaxID=2340821 RepID=UPI00197EE797|nr:type II toxin-antitoxin system VapC family toxin [Nocardioides ferulae]